MLHGREEDTIGLDGAQLRAGSVSYAGPRDSLDFRLEVVGADQRVSSESVMMLSEDPAAPSRTPAAPHTGSDDRAKLVAAEETTPAPRKMFVPPPAPVLQAAIQRQEVVPPPSINTAPAPVPGLGSLGVPVVHAPPPAGKTDPVAVYTPAPQIPHEVARFANGKAVVRVAVEISAQGRVTNAHVLSYEGSGAAFLIGPMLATARQYRFKPALLAGKAVASVSTIEFRFHE